MTPEQAPDFISRLTTLSELFGARLSEATQVLYFEALQDLELDWLIRAISQSAKHCKFMPKPVELREFAIGPIEDQALVAWNGWRRAARLGGASRSLICDSAAAFAIENTFGSWPEACVLELSPEMWASKRKEFTQNYRIALLREYLGPYRFLKGTGTIDNKWNKTLFLDDDGGVVENLIEDARAELKNGPDERTFNELCPGGPNLLLLP